MKYKTECIKTCMKARLKTVRTVQFRSSLTYGQSDNAESYIERQLNGLTSKLLC